MKQIITIALIALLPVISFAGNGEKKTEKIDVKVTLDKKGKVEVSGLTGDLKELQEDINEALKDVNVQINGNHKKRELHIKATIKTEN